MNPAADWSLEDRSGVLVLRCAPLACIPGITHAFSTRRCDERDDFDLGGADAPAVGPIQARRERFLAAAGFETSSVALLRQVHGNRIVRAARAPSPPEADGVFWTARDSLAPLPSVRTADCVPVLLASRDGRSVAAVHAGWRGTAAKVVLCAVQALGEDGVTAEELVAAIGPCIGPCCYVVGREVLRAVAGADSAGEGPGVLDLREANRRQLAAAGVAENRIFTSNLCTACRPELFFSFRRDREASGRMMAAIGPTRP